VANYNVDIGIALKGAEKVRAFNNSIKALSENIKNANFFLTTFAKNNDGLVRNISNLQKNLGAAAQNLKNVALNQKEATIAAAQFVKAQDELNKGLIEQQKLLDDVSGKTAKKAGADNKRLQDSLLKLERQSTKEQEQQFLLRQQGEDQLKQKVREINKQRKEENKLIKQNVQQTKKTVAEEIKKKFSIIASQNERRKNFKQSIKELEANRKQIPINDRINAQLKKRGLILSSNGKQIISNNQNRNRRGMGGGLTNAIGSGIIGGGFPLLFGQGATAALGGGIGGVAGGLIGGQFGFALSIAGTTIGSTLDQLSKALLKPTENIEMLVNRLGLAGTETGDLALRLQKLGLESDAAELLLKEFETRFGLTADEIKENSETLRNFNNEINKLGTSLTLMMANVLNPLIKELNNLIKGKRPEGISRGVTGTIDFFTANALDLDKRGGILDPALKKLFPSKISNIPPAEGNAVIGDVSLNPAFGTNPDFSGIIKAKKDLEKTFLQQKEILPLQQALEIEKDRLKLTKNQITFKQEEFKLDNLKKDLQFLESKRTDKINQDLELKIKKLKLNIDLQETVLDNLREEGFELDELSKKFMDIGASIEKSIVGNLTDAVMGTQSLGQAAVNVLNNLKRKIIEVQIEQAVSGIGKGIGGFLGNLFKRERGGPVSAGGAYLVGEKGPEILQMGSRGGNIIPNNKIEGGTTNMVTVNVDASGSSVAGSNADAQALGAVIGAAVQAQLVKEKRPGGLLTR
tara:strand:+ start:112 stop:2355 length:2244 start_codon:yes stop_codon:yes gene_type:complete